MKHLPLLFSVVGILAFSSSCTSGPGYGPGYGGAGYGPPRGHYSHGYGHAGPKKKKMGHARKKYMRPR